MEVLPEGGDAMNDDWICSDTVCGLWLLVMFRHIRHC